MKEFLSQFGYVLDTETNVWARPEYGGIAYSDGEDVERRIASIVKESTDLSVLSVELRQHCTDWPSIYHLSGSRSNILRPFEDDIRGDVLEIGAGCGAITRYLGECGGSVLSLEGSHRRAAIAKSRTRDLPNVAVVCDNFSEFHVDHRFDVITLIGVLEYANLFVKDDNPPLAMLMRVRSLLKPDGKLILAIENQLGLKYFAGAPEDHIGQAMYGLEGRYQKDQPQTYGRKRLLDMLKQAGFENVEFFAPFPDYKLPVSIVTEAGFACDAFDAGALAWQSVRRDPQLSPRMSFSPELVWSTVFENEIGLDLANSFLVVAGNSAGGESYSPILAWHFSTERSKEFCKETRFIHYENGAIDACCRLLLDDSRGHAQEKLLTFHLPEKTEYVQGRLLSQDLIQVVSRDGWCMSEVGAFVERYLSILRSIRATHEVALRITSADTLLPGDLFDVIPQNIMVSGAGQYHVIDNEWTLNNAMPAGWLIFRSLLPIINSITRFGETASEFENTALAFFRSVFKSVGFNVTDEDIESYARLEMGVQAEVAGRVIDVDAFNEWLRKAELRSCERLMSVCDYNQKITDLNQGLAERTEEIAGLRKAIFDTDCELRELKNTLAAVYASKSWKITRPLRSAYALLVNRKLLVNRITGVVSKINESLRKNGFFDTIRKIGRHGRGQGVSLRYSSVPQPEIDAATNADVGMVGLPHRKLTLISMIKNEKNILETFAAHALAMFDRVIFVDHQSSDGSGAYMRALADEYPQIEYYMFDEPGYYQSEVMTWVVSNLIGSNEDGWIFFLDADEYLPFTSRAECDRELAKYASFPVISMPWLNLVPLDMDSGQVKGGVFMRPPKTAAHHKIAFQPGLIPFDDYVVAQGNHALLVGKGYRQLFPAEEAFPIYHLPIRTKQQLRDKIRHGVESYRKMGADRGENLGFHWDDINRLMEDNGLTDDLMADMISRYGEPMVPPYGKSLNAMVQEGYAEIKLDICTDGPQIRFQDCIEEQRIDSCVSGVARESGNRNSRRELPIVLDSERRTLKFRCG